MEEKTNAQMPEVPDENAIEPSASTDESASVVSAEDDSAMQDNPDVADVIAEDNINPVILKEKDAAVESENSDDESSALLALSDAVDDVRNSSSKIATELHGLHRLYHTEIANRISSMQSELERYREIEKGRIFDDILSEIAKIYSEYETLVDEVADEKTKKKIRYMFLDILQLFESNDVSKQKSDIGDKRNVKHCRIIEQIPTDNSELHDTVVESKNTGFNKEGRTYVHESVKIHVFSKDTENLETKQEVNENE
jgi:hypothetical protein